MIFSDKMLTKFYIIKTHVLLLTLALSTNKGISQNKKFQSNSIIMESISPNIFVHKIQETISFYQKLGFQIQAKNPDTDSPDFVLMTCGNITVMFQTFGSIGDQLPVIKKEKGGSLLLYIQMKNIREYYEKIKDEVKVYKELEKTFYGALEFSIVDNNQYLLTFAEPQEK
jgi:uncharacterized glyoxalase superfamily protein PhnB